MGNAHDAFLGETLVGVIAAGNGGRHIAIVLPLSAGAVRFYDADGNAVEYLRKQL